MGTVRSGDGVGCSSACLPRGERLRGTSAVLRPRPDDAASRSGRGRGVDDAVARCGFGGPGAGVVTLSGRRLCSTKSYGLVLKQCSYQRGAGRSYRADLDAYLRGAGVRVRGRAAEAAHDLVGLVVVVNLIMPRAGPGFGPGLTKPEVTIPSASLARSPKYVLSQAQARPNASLKPECSFSAYTRVGPKPEIPARKGEKWKPKPGPNILLGCKMKPKPGPARPGFFGPGCP